MAIDIKTLRIGSHILVKGVRARVVRLSTLRYDENEAFHLLVRGISPDTGKVGEVGCFVDDKAVQPIPITPELLKELGLNVISHGCSEHWFLGNFDLTHNTDSCYWDYEGDIQVEFLHELEDLYYLKYGVELNPD